MYFAFILIYVLIVTNIILYYHRNKFTGLNKNEKIKLLKCMKDVHKTFEKNGVWYIIAFGTLLGAVRHGHIIPWDDDIDLIVNFSQLKGIRTCLKELESIGYRITESKRLIRIYSDNKRFIDLFIVDVENGKITRCLLNNNVCKYPSLDIKWYHKDFWFPEKYINGKRKYRLNSLELWGPSDPHLLLEHWYGKDYMTVCRTPELINHTYITKSRVIPCPKV